MEVHGLTDEQLIARAANIEPDALGELYDRHGVAAFALARRMLGPAHAEDAVQEAFLSLWRGAARYQPVLGPVRPWLLGMVRNRSIDVLRKLDVHERRRIDDVGFEDRLETAGSTEERVERSDEASTIRTALAALPRTQRDVVELAYFGGLTQQEIAERLELPLGTVKGRTRLAFDKLRIELAACAPG